MDKETVMTWLEICRENDDCSDCCPYGDDGETFDCKAKLMTDVLALLKTQEAELSYRNAKTIIHTATKLDDATCPSCGNVVRVRYDYCHYCGQKLNWEGR